MTSSLTRLEEYAPLRIHYELGGIQLESALQDYLINTMITSAKAYLSNSLQTKSVDQVINLEQSECAGMLIPSYYRFYGFGHTDVVIFVTGGQASVEQGSWAAPCTREMDGLEQIVAGRIWLNASQIEKNSDSDNIRMMIHQTLHVLGFHSNAYPYWKDSTGAAYEAPQPVSSGISRGKPVWKLTTEGALAQARIEFGCDELEGIDLESSGQINAAGSNWEKRIMYNDILARGLEFESNLYSKISLLALQDTGWYQANLDYGQEVVWGKGRGCTFFTNLCVLNSDPQFPEFCSDFNESSKCDVNRTSKGVCGLTSYFSAIPAEYQYFHSEYIGGADIAMDYCPYIVPFQSGDCRDTSHTANEVYGERFGPTSRCLEGNYVKTGNTARVHAGCHEMTCNEDETITILIGTTFIICSKYGGMKRIAGFAGYVECPDYDTVCGNAIPCPDGCLGRGTWLNGICVCEDGWTGTNCSQPCYMTCASCSGTGQGDCLTCKGQGTWSSGTGTCGCIKAFDPETGDCEDECSPINLKEIDSSGFCAWMTDPQLQIDFSGEEAILISGTDSGIIIDSCEEPYLDFYRGAYFTGTQSLEIVNFATQSQFAIQLWARPSLGGTLVYVPIGNGLGANLWMSECNGIILDWGWDRVESSRDSVSTLSWSRIDFIASYDAPNVLRQTVYVNGYVSLFQTTSTLFNQAIDENEWLGSVDGIYNFYIGWMYQFRYWPYARPLDPIDIACEDADNNGAGDCPIWLDDGKCISECPLGSASLSRAGACVTCEACDPGCDGNTGSAVCWAAPSGSCPTQSCAANCLFCSGSGEDECYACEAGYQLDTLAPSTCSECTDCHHTSMANPPTSCNCEACYYYSSSSSKCLKCSMGCASCSDGRYSECTSCDYGYYLLAGGNACANGCPTGWDATEGRCKAWVDGRNQWSINLNTPEIDVQDWPITLSGGFTSGDSFIDDPYKNKNRGAWFDGELQHFTVNGLVLNHSFTFEFFVKNYGTSEASLFASYQNPYDFNPLSVSIYSLGMRKNELVFRITNHNVYIETHTIAKYEIKWGHFAVGLEWNAYDRQTQVRFWKDTKVVETDNMVTAFTNDVANDAIDMCYYFLDSCLLGHYIGGVRHDWKLFYPFHGYMYQVHIAQYAKKEFSTTTNSGTQCNGSCAFCPCDGICPENCSWNEYADTGGCSPCRQSCHRGCTNGYDCNLCSGNCEVCYGWQEDECGAQPQI